MLKAKNALEKVHLLQINEGERSTRDFLVFGVIAKDIMVCENKTVTRWDGTIGQYKNHLRKKMVSTGAV